MSNPLIKSTASTMQKVANLPRYHHPADLVHMPVRPIRQQRMEINGDLEFGANLYPSELQENFIKQIKQSRGLFANSSLQNKAKIASSQYDAWRRYLHQLTLKLPNTLLIQGDKKQKVYESYLIAKQRNQQKMQLNKTVKLFYQISMGFKFDIAIHPLVMIRMVYPRYGYLNNFKDQRLTFDEYVKFLEQMIAVSQFFNQGSTLHGYQLLSFVFWKVYWNKPTMNSEQFSKFLSLFKFNTKPETLSTDLSYHLTNRVGQIKEGSPVRFEFWKNIFLERGL